MYVLLRINRPSPGCRWIQIRSADTIATPFQQCPHSSYPLSQGIPFDIEDFGIVLSAGLTCPKHNWYVKPGP